MSSENRTHAWPVVLLILSVTALGLYIGNVTSNRKVSLEIVNQDEIDFGEQWVKKGLKKRFVLRNNGGGPVAITDVRASCGCVDIQPRELHLPPKSEKSLIATLDLTPMDLANTEPYVRRAITFIAIVKDGQPFHWQSRGMAKCAFTVEPSVIAFTGAAALLSHSEAQAIPLKVRPLHPIKTITATCDQSLGSVDVAEIEDGSFCVYFAPNTLQEPGPIDDDIEIAAENASGDLLSSVFVRVFGIIEPDIVALPERIDLGLIEKGSAADATLTVRSQTNQPFSVVSISPSSSQISTQDSTNASAPAHDVTIIASCVEVGLQTADLAIEIKNADSRGPSKTQILTVPIHYVGVDTTPRD